MPLKWERNLLKKEVYESVEIPEPDSLGG